MHTHTHQITMGLAFFLGAVHALEPGHGKTAMLLYLSHKRRSFLHPLVMGISSAVSHSLSLIGVAMLVHAAQYAVTGTTDTASDTVEFWLRAISAALVMSVGAWMLISARRSDSPTPCCSCGNHSEHQHSDDSPSGGGEGNHKSDHRSDLSVSVLLGAAFGLLPCPSAVAAYLTGMAHGSATEAYTSIALFAVGIATSLTFVGLVIQRFGSLLSNGTSGLSKLPWATMRAVLVMAVGAVSGMSLVL